MAWMDKIKALSTEDLAKHVDSYDGEKRQAILDELDARGYSKPLGEVATEAMSNLPGSAAQFVDDITYPFRHPIDTAGALVDLGQGVYEKVMPGDQGYATEAEMATDVGQFFADRYGGVENIKRTVAEDPVGSLADIASVLTGGGPDLDRPLKTSTDRRTLYGW